MSALFSSYEQELTALVTSLKARANNSIDERFAEDLREAQALITQLEIEARAANAGQEVRARVNRLKDDLKALGDRSSLFMGSKKPNEGRQSGSLSKFVEDEEALNRSERVSQRGLTVMSKLTTLN
jgi:hypothetical protein